MVFWLNQSYLLTQDVLSEQNNVDVMTEQHSEILTLQYNF